MACMLSPKTRIERDGDSHVPYLCRPETLRISSVRTGFMSIMSSVDKTQAFFKQKSNPSTKKAPKRIQHMVSHRAEKRCELWGMGRGMYRLVLVGGRHEAQMSQSFRFHS